MPGFAIHKYLFLFLGTTWDIYLFHLDDFQARYNAKNFDKTDNELFQNTSEYLN